MSVVCIMAVRIHGDLISLLDIIFIIIRTDEIWIIRRLNGTERAYRAVSLPLDIRDCTLYLHTSQI